MKSEYTSNIPAEIGPIKRYKEKKIGVIEDGEPIYYCDELKTVIVGQRRFIECTKDSEGNEMLDLKPVF